MRQFKPQQLPSLIEYYKVQEFSGVLFIQVNSAQQNQTKTRVIAFYKGWMTYAGPGLMTPNEFIRLLSGICNVKFMDSALQIAKKKVKDNESIREYLELLVRLGFFQWQEVEAYMQKRILMTLEELIPYGGTCTQDSEVSFDLFYSQDRPGFSWKDLEPVYTKRQQKWTTFATLIPSLDAVPRILNIHQAEPYAAEHMQKWVDGLRSLLDIAVALDQDPLDLAQQYYKWAKKDWLTCSTSMLAGAKTSDDSERPIVLSVDDSPVVQIMIQRAICDRYQVLLANNAVDALNILNTKNVSLVLLDVTMPDIDGLELCRTIRSIGKFRDLPVIMLTAKDGMFNKLKGQMAGSTQYLTKPVTRDKLLKVIEKYTPQTLTL